MTQSLSDNHNIVNFLALGDSYTIGESVRKEGRWPDQLASVFEYDQFDITYIAQTGWTTDELKQGIKSHQSGRPYDIVSLLIGVNNQYRGYKITQYKKEFKELLELAIAFAGEDPKKVFVLSIPDYGVTPYVEDRGLNGIQIGKELDQYNSVAALCCEKHSVTFFDITKISKEAANNLSLIASDGLHPSAKMYQKWVEIVTPWLTEQLK